MKREREPTRVDRDEMIREISCRSGFTLKDVGRTYDIFIGMIHEYLLEGRPVRIHGTLTLVPPGKTNPRVRSLISGRLRAAIRRNK